MGTAIFKIQCLSMKRNRKYKEVSRIFVWRLQSTQDLARKSRSYMCAQSCPTLCNPMACSPPGPSVHRISQARILEWVAISYSRGSSRPRDGIRVSCIAGGLFTDQ